MLKFSKGAKHDAREGACSTSANRPRYLPMGMKHLTLGHRAWYALQALAGAPGVRPPSKHSLEVKYGLSNKDLSRLIWDVYERPSYEKMGKFAAALGTTPEWLDREEGPGPVIDWIIAPRPPPPPGMAKKTKSGSLKRVREG